MVLNAVMNIAIKSFQQNLIAINAKEVKDIHREMLTKLLQYHITLQEKNINAQHLLLCNNLKQCHAIMLTKRKQKTVRANSVDFVEKLFWKI